MLVLLLIQEKVFGQVTGENLERDFYQTLVGSPKWILQSMH